jgi:putative peptidoglycan lipid II flippase
VTAQKEFFCVSINAVSEPHVQEVRPLQPSTLKSSLRFGLVSLLAYTFSFAKSLITARYFGTSAEMDAFTLAFLVPNLLATLLIGTFAISVVPALATAELKGKDARANMFRASLFLFVAIASLLALLVAVFSPEIMAVVALHFDGPKRLLAAALLCWITPILPLTAICAFCSAELLSRKRYVAVAAAPIISTVVSVAALLLFSGIGVKVLAFGLVLGTVFQAVAVAAPAWRANPLSDAMRWWTPEIRELARQQLPLLLVSSFGVLNVSVDQFMAGLLPSGSAAALNFANSLNAVVVQTVVMAASWVVLPQLSELAAAQDLQGLALKVRQSMLGIAQLAIPMAILIFILGGTAVRLFFQHGRFDSTSTRQVSAIWIGYTCGLLPFAIAMVPVRLLNALRRNNLLVRVGLVALPINAGLDYLFMVWLGPVGISLSTSTVYLCTSILVLWFVRGIVPGIFDWKLWAGMLRALAVSALAGALLYGFRELFHSSMVSLFGGTALFAALILSLYHWCGLVHVPFKKYWAVIAQ